MTFALLGLFGAAFAISGVLFVLPLPAAGGTCGPGRASEAPIVALLDPVSIGAGPEPAASEATSRGMWLAFVSECQSSTDNRAIAALVILVLSIGVAVVGPRLVLTKAGNRDDPARSDEWERDWRV